MVIPGPSVMPLSFWSIIHRVTEVNTPVSMLLILGCDWFKACELIRTSHMTPKQDIAESSVFQVVSVVEFIQAENHLHNASQLVHLDDVSMNIQ